MDFAKATLNDLEEIIPLMHAAVQFMNANGNVQWDKEYPSPEVFKNDIKKGDLYKVQKSGNILGVVCLNDMQSAEYKHIPWKTPEHSLVIHRMLVAPQWRGKGIAKRMFQQAEHVAIRMGFSSIRSDTNQANVSMNHLFQQFGYRYTGDITLRQNPVPFHCYEKQLV